MPSSCNAPYLLLLAAVVTVNEDEDGVCGGDEGDSILMVKAAVTTT